MLFSVLIAHYNNAKYLAQCIDSVLHQTYKTWEIVLVDDGSTDHYREVLDQYTGYANIRIYFNDQNRGVSFTKHRLLGLAHGELAAFLDPDDALTPDALYTMVSAHMLHPECSIINSTHFVCDDQLNVERVSEKPRALPKETPYLLVGDGSIHAFATFKVAAYRKSRGLIPERRFDKAIDQDLYYLLEEHGSVLFINKPLYYYRIHKGSISNMGQERKAMIEHFELVEMSCKRRMQKLAASVKPEDKEWYTKYRVRYNYARILRGIRSGNWVIALPSLLAYPFVGGADHLKQYLSKLRSNGMSVFKRSFVETYKH